MRLRFVLSVGPPTRPFQSSRHPASTFDVSERAQRFLHSLVLFFHEVLKALLLLSVLLHAVVSCVCVLSINAFQFSRVRTKLMQTFLGCGWRQVLQTSALLITSSTKAMERALRAPNFSRSKVGDREREFVFVAKGYVMRSTPANMYPTVFPQDSALQTFPEETRDQASCLTALRVLMDDGNTLSSREKFVWQTRLGARLQCLPLREDVMTKVNRSFKSEEDENKGSRSRGTTYARLFRRAWQ